MEINKMEVRDCVVRIIAGLGFRPAWDWGGYNYGKWVDRDYLNIRVEDNCLVLWVPKSDPVCVSFSDPDLVSKVREFERGFQGGNQ